MTDPKQDAERPVEEETEIGVYQPEFAWETFAADEDESRRAYVMSTVSFEASAEAKLIIDTWVQAEHWLKTGNALVPIDNDPMPKFGKKLKQHQ